jgi:CRISPR-associated protein Csm1
MDRSFGGMRQTHYKTYQKLSGNGSIVSFEELAGNDEGAGILAALKADVDNLGAIFACGLCDEKGAQESGNTFSRFSSLSRSFHHFFSYYISRLAAEKEYKVYTVFAGGDELFIVGNFKDIVDLSLDITEKFRQYSGGNKEVTLSAGIVFCGANTPIWYMAEEAESLLGTAKTLREGEKEKGRLAIADYAGKWEEFRKEKKAFEEFLGSLHKEIKSSGFFYRLLSFSDMSINTKEEKGGLKLHNLMWRPYLRYMVGRLNKLDDDGRKSVCEKLHRWIDEKPELLKALVSLEIYKNRKGGRK